MEDITDADNMNTERVCKEFEIQDFAEYHSLYCYTLTFLKTSEKCI